MRVLALVALVALAAAHVCAGAVICNVLARGAKGDNVTDDRAALQGALDDRTCDEVLLPAPFAFVSRALNLSLMSFRTLRIEPGAVLVAWRDPATYAPVAGPIMPLLWSDETPLLEGLVIQGGAPSSAGGGGAIAGGGAAWWRLGHNADRPHLVSLPNVRNATITGLTLVDSPAHNLVLRGRDISVTHLRVEAGLDSCDGFSHAPNTDGANVGGQNILIHDLWVHNGDDCIPVTTPGAAAGGGNTFGVYADSVHCECGTNGAVIYNEGGTVSGAVFNDFGVHHTNQGAGAKISRPGRNATGGLVTNITFSNYHILSPRYAALYVNAYGPLLRGCAAIP